MSLISLKFGDVFLFEEKEYIFLARTDILIYAGDIVEEKLQKQIENLCKKRIINGQSIDNNKLFCYVILKTKELRGRMVNFAKTGSHHFHSVCTKLPITLIQEDLKEIKKELTTKKAIIIELKELIKNIKI